MSIRSFLAGRFVTTFQLAPTELVSSESPEGEASDAQYIFNTDGTIQERRDQAAGGTVLSTSAGSPWSNRVGEDGSGKFIKLVHATGTDRRTDALGNGFIELDSQRIFTFRNGDTSGPYSGNSTYDVTLSLDGSTDHDAQTLTITLANAGP